MAENKDKKVLNVPNIRFKEFKEEWEECKISDILSIGNGRDYRHLDNGNIPVFGTGGCITSVNEYLYDGETTFIGRKGTINKPFYYDGKFWSVDTLFYTHSFIDVTPKFVFCLFQTINWLRYNEASGVPSLSKDTIEKIKIKIPRQAEQKKIVNLLFALDERIATQNKIIGELKQLKICVRTLIFKALNCSWFLLSELEANGDICLKRGNIIPKHEHTDIFCYPVYSSSVQNGGLMGYNNTYMFNTELVTWSIDGGGNFFYRHKHKFNVTNVSGYMQLNEAKYNYRFVSEILLWQHSFMVFDYQTKAHPSVIKSIYKLPDISLAEQELIANIFRLLDVKLQNEMTILKQYQQQKQYLLRQMFI